MTAPRKIGRYEVTEELGRGGMATVFRAYDPRFKREVALKLLPPQFTHDPMFRARFEREAETIAALEHWAIVPVYDFGEEENQPYLVMRLMTGGSLADRLEQGPLPVTESARVLDRIGAALDRAHELGVVHRDLKPGNILFDQYGEAFLADFGIARLAEANATLTGSGVVGTPAYMSPEQIQGGQIDGRTDIYALGIILFEMLTGKKPYEADTPAMLLVKQMTEPVPHILEVKPDLPPEFEPLLSRAMAKEREQRFSRASDMSQTLTAISQGQTGTQSPKAKAPILPSAEPEVNAPTRAVPTATADVAVTDRPTPRRWVIIAAAVILILLLSFLAVRTFSPDGDTAERVDTNDSLPATPTTTLSPDQAPDTPIRSISINDVSQITSRPPLGRGTIESSALSPDGRILATGGSLGIWLYEVETLEPQLLLSGHQDLVAGLAWSPDGDQIASASWDQTIRIWDTNIGAQIGILTGDEQFLDVAWSPDGNVLATSSWETGIDLWEVANGRSFGQLVELNGWVDLLSWSGRLASGGEDGIVRVWDTESQQALWSFAGHQGEINCLVWSPDQTRLASCGEEDSTLRVWSVPANDNGRAQPAAPLAVLGKRTSQDSGNEPPILQLPAHEYGVYDMAWSPDGQFMATAGGDNSVRLWETDSGRQIDTLLDLDTVIVDLTWLPDNQRLIAIGDDGSMRLFNVGSRLVEKRVQDHTSSVWGIAWSPDGALIASAGSDSTLRIWDAVSATVLQTLDAHMYGMRSVAWSPDGRYIATSGEDGFVRLWLTDEWWPEQEWSFEENVISAMAWSPDGSLLLLADVNGGLQIYGIDSRQEVLAWQAHEAEVNDVVFSPDGQLVASSSLDRTIGIWQVAGGQQVWRLEGHEDEVKGLAWSPNGDQLASSSFDQTVRLWNAETGELVRQLNGHEELVVDVAWSPNGELLASVGWDNQAHLWQAGNGRPLRQLTGHVSAVLSAAWSPAGDQLATSGDDGTIRLWGLEE